MFEWLKNLVPQLNRLINRVLGNPYPENKDFDVSKLLGDDERVLKARGAANFNPPEGTEVLNNDSNIDETPKEDYEKSLQYFDDEPDLKKELPTQEMLSPDELEKIIAFVAKTREAFKSLRDLDAFDDVLEETLDQLKSLFKHEKDSNLHQDLVQILKNDLEQERKNISPPPLSSLGEKSASETRNILDFVAKTKIDLESALSTDDIDKIFKESIESMQELFKDHPLLEKSEILLENYARKYIKEISPIEVIHPGNQRIKPEKINISTSETQKILDFITEVKNDLDTINSVDGIDSVLQEHKKHLHSRFANNPFLNQSEKFIEYYAGKIKKELTPIADISPDNKEESISKEKEFDHFSNINMKSNTILEKESMIPPHPNIENAPAQSPGIFTTMWSYLKGRFLDDKKNTYYYDEESYLSDQEQLEQDPSFTSFKKGDQPNVNLQYFNIDYLDSMLYPKKANNHFDRVPGGHDLFNNPIFLSLISNNVKKWEHTLQNDFKSVDLSGFFIDKNTKIPQEHIENLSKLFAAFETFPIKVGDYVSSPTDVKNINHMSALAKFYIERESEIFNVEKRNINSIPKIDKYLDTLTVTFNSSDGKEEKKQEKSLREALCILKANKITLNPKITTSYLNLKPEDVMIQIQNACQKEILQHEKIKQPLTIVKIRDKPKIELNISIYQKKEDARIIKELKNDIKKIDSAMTPQKALEERHKIHEKIATHSLFKEGNTQKLVRFIEKKFIAKWKEHADLTLTHCTDENSVKKERKNLIRELKSQTNDLNKNTVKDIVGHINKLASSSLKDIHMLLGLDKDMIQHTIQNMKKGDEKQFEILGKAINELPGLSSNMRQNLREQLLEQYKDGPKDEEPGFPPPEI